jgi:acylphosphatase
VELLVEGAKEELEAFLDAIRQSDVGQFIRQEQACWSEAKNEFCGFEITH